jgi:hypothetical protein
VIQILDNGQLLVAAAQLLYTAIRLYDKLICGGFDMEERTCGRFMLKASEIGVAILDRCESGLCHLW